MSHSIVWLDSVTSAITQFYEQAVSDSGREVAAINQALARVIDALESNPWECGESRSGALRVLVEIPLVIDFEVVDADRVVVVLKAHYCPGPTKD